MKIPIKYRISAKGAPTIKPRNRRLTTRDAFENVKSSLKSANP